MTANEDMSIKKPTLSSISKCPKKIVNTSQMAMDHLNKLYTKFGIAGGAITRIMTHYNSGLDAHTHF
jgi:hypothetical protein